MNHFHSGGFIKSHRLLGNLQSFVKASKYVVCLWAGVVYAGALGGYTSRAYCPKAFGQGPDRGVSFLAFRHGPPWSAVGSYDNAS